MFVPVTPAETTGYMLLGFAFVFIPMLVYVWSLAARRKKLLETMTLLKEVDSQGK